MATEVHRVERKDAGRFQSKGWRLLAGWFTRASGMEWAWFVREVADG